MLNFKQIEAFRVVMLRGTMTSAAEELHTSQPSISRLISELEHQLQLKLFIRQSGRLQPTEAGNAFYQEVQRSFIGLDTLSRSAEQIRLFGTGKLRVTGTPAIVMSVIPYVIAQYRTSYPNVLISLDMRSESTVRRWTSSSYCDIGFATTAVETMGINTETLYRLPALCVMSVHHPLAKQDVIHIKDFENQKIIIPTDNNNTLTALEKALKKAKITPIPVIETPYGALTGLLAAQNIAIGLINPIIALDLQLPNIVFKPINANIFFEGYVLYPKPHAYNPMVRDFILLTQQRIAAMSDMLPQHKMLTPNLGKNP